jgi:hypothetical protein
MEVGMDNYKVTVGTDTVLANQNCNGGLSGAPTIDRKAYEDDLRKRQDEHLKGIGGGDANWQPCLHDGCPECLGTGRKKDGGICVHGISCPCPKCSPIC